MKHILAIAVGALLLLCACSYPTLAATPGPLVSELAMLTGPNARQCGLVQLGEDPTDAWKCALAADSSDTPHWFAMQRQGIDSEAWVASLLAPSGERFILTYDSNYMGGPGLLPRFIRDTCAGRVVLTPTANAGLQCRRQEP